jgi:hypothetical protein
MDHTNNHSHSEEKGLFYTYFGKNGSATAAFLYFLVLLVALYSFLRWG